MATLTSKQADGGDGESVELPDSVFGIEPNVGVMHQVVTAQLAAKRSGTASTKTRSEVRGGGAKPWRQKGTGRARQGSIRSPQWVGGGISLGPQPHDHAMRVNKKMKRGALRSALTDTVQSGKIAVISELSFDEPKTKRATELLSSLELDGKVVVVLAQPTEDGAVEKSFRNLRGVKVAYAGGLGTYDLLWADRVLFTADALDAIEARGTKRDPAPKRQPKDETNEEVSS
jgi:large subunit ribosomal protein L4